MFFWFAKKGDFASSQKFISFKLHKGQQLWYSINL